LQGLNKFKAEEDASMIMSSSSKIHPVKRLGWSILLSVLAVFLCAGFAAAAVILAIDQPVTDTTSQLTISWTWDDGLANPTGIYTADYLIGNNWQANLTIGPAALRLEWSAGL
jgi:hypothetical protein